jgi:hypothetical protein
MFFGPVPTGHGHLGEKEKWPGRRLQSTALDAILSPSQAIRLL